MTRILVLDLWGTLVATPGLDGHRAALRLCAERLGVDAEAFCDAYQAKRLQRDTGAWTRDAVNGEPLEAIYLKRLVVQCFPTLATQLSNDDVLEAAQHLFDNTHNALDVSRIVPGAIDGLAQAREKGAITVLCSDAGPWMRTALLNTPLSEHLDGMVISAETGFLKPAREAFDAVIALAGELLRTRSDSRPPQFIFLADGGSFDADRTNDAGGPYTELQGADEAEFDSVLQVDHVRESNGELIYERRDTGWPEMLSFHDVTTALYALNARP